MLTALLTLAIAAPSLRFDPATPRLGDPLLVYVMTTTGSKGRAQLLGLEVPVSRVSTSSLFAVFPIPIDEKPGRYPIVVHVGGKKITGEVEVRGRSFRTSELKVDSQFTSKKSKALQKRIRRESAEWADAFRAEPGPLMVRGAFVRPVDSSTTSEFGVRRTFNGRLASTHYGLDLDGATGDPIHAIGAGRVILSSDRWASGGTVVLDHGGGLYSSYFHMSKRERERGAKVGPRDRLGAVGKTGRVTGPHLHLAILIRAIEKGKARTFYVDPAVLLRRVIDPP